MTLGEFNETQLPSAQRQPLIQKLLDIYETDPNAGLHGAAEWLLGKWGRHEQLQAVVTKLCCNEEELQVRMATDKREWYINTQGQTMVVVDAGEFLMGSLESERGHTSEEGQHHRRIGKRFAISATEVTRAQYGRFQRAHPEAKVAAGDWIKTDDSPQVGMNWFEAASYCNWLSEQEGIDKSDWCFERNESGEYGPGLKPKEKFWELRGYRLPTEAEWEYACRAGTVTSRYYGVTETLLPQYAWYQVNGENRTWPVASLKPNNIGLFDMLGNAWEWCIDLNLGYSKPLEKLEKPFDGVPDTEPVQATDRRVLRGGAFATLPINVRSADRNGYRADDRDSPFGFRPARTFP